MHVMHQFYKVSTIPNRHQSHSRPHNLLDVGFFSALALAWESRRYRIGGAKRDRTADPLRARQVLSQLSYSPRVRLRPPRPITLFLG